MKEKDGHKSGGGRIQGAPNEAVVVAEKFVGQQPMDGALSVSRDTDMVSAMSNQYKANSLDLKAAEYHDSSQ